MDVQLLKWTLTVLYALGALGTVMAVGQERKPLSGGVAAFVVAVDAALIAWIQTSL